jgi:heme/copper-type cytochrome/quinol oxidase subunit 2
MRSKQSLYGLQKKSRLLIPCILVLFSFLQSAASYAQCAMCRASLESEGNNPKAEAVNDGIVYLMAIPYILVAVIGYFIYKTGKKLNKK